MPENYAVRIPHFRAHKKTTGHLIMHTQNLSELEGQLKEELKLLGFPPQPWMPSSDVLDIAIIGAGMAGLCASFALMCKGIHNQQIFDESQSGYEGPWSTYAKMLTLRSGKDLIGPALWLPKLTFQAWYTAQHGADGWLSLYKIPTPLWMEYLRWYQKILNLPVHNNSKVLSIIPQEDKIIIEFIDGNVVYARKIILATGLKGFGGADIPPQLEELPKKFYAHTSETIDYTSFKNERIIVLGAGASAFDAAAESLEHQAGNVIMLTRRNKIPSVNKFARTVYPGFGVGYHLLPDSLKIAFMDCANKAGSPPPFESLDRVQRYLNFKVMTGYPFESIKIKNNIIQVSSKKETIEGDFLIAATGYAVDGFKVPILKHIINDILLWEDQHELPLTLRGFPYLGDHYQFLDKQLKGTTYLRNIYCFNYAATLSHGKTSGDIPDISIGAERLARGIAADFFTQKASIYLDRFMQDNIQEFDELKYSFIVH